MTLYPPIPLLAILACLLVMWLAFGLAGVVIFALVMAAISMVPR